MCRPCCPCCASPRFAALHAAARRGAVQLLAAGCRRALAGVDMGCDARVPAVDVRNRQFAEATCTVSVGNCVEIFRPIAVSEGGGGGGHAGGRRLSPTWRCLFPTPVTRWLARIRPTQLSTSPQICTEQAQTASVPARSTRVFSFEVRRSTGEATATGSCTGAIPSPHPATRECAEFLHLPRVACPFPCAAAPYPTHPCVLQIVRKMWYCLRAQARSSC